MLWLCVLCGTVGAAEDRPASNLEIMRSLSATVADSLAGECRGRGIDSVNLIMRPGDTAWLIEGVIVQSLADRGVHVVTDSAAGVTVGIQDLGVEYSELRGSALLGGKEVDRRIYLRAETLLSPVAGTVSTRSYDCQQKDTVATSAIPFLENRAIPATVGTIPGGGFFQNLTEPLIVIGALVVGVLLLFNVRS
jgi:hypothetical protein